MGVLDEVGGLLGGSIGEDGAIPSVHRTIEIDGEALEEEIDAQVELVNVIDRLSMPDAFEVVFRDPDHEVLEAAKVEIGAKVRISTTSSTGEAPEPLVWGEVTSLEVEYDVLGSRAVVRGYDVLHRLAAGRKTRTYQDMTYSDIAEQLAGEAGLDADVDESGKTYEHVIQANQSDLDFLYSLAREIDYDLTVEEDTLIFKEAAGSEGAPGPGDYDSEDPRQLVWDHNLKEFRARMSAVAQVSEVKVRGWDVETKKAVIGRAPISTPGPDVPLTPGDLAKAVGGSTLVVTDRPVGDQSAAEDLARSIASQVGSSAYEATAVVIGAPELKAGVAVTVSQVDPALAGDWIITTARHEFGRNGYRTHLEFSGRQDRSLYGLVTNGGSSAVGRSAIPSIVIGVVDQNDDPEKKGRIKVQFPWLGEEAVSYWARFAMPSAGKDHGMIWVPEVGDEVVVAFEQGDIAHPIIIGSLWNGVNALPPTMMENLFDKGKVKRTALVSPGGQKLMFYDAKDDSGIMLITEDKSVRLILGQSDKRLKLYSEGKLEVYAAADLEINVDGSIKIEAGNALDLKAQGNVTIKGAKVAIN